MDSVSQWSSVCGAFKRRWNLEDVRYRGGSEVIKGVPSKDMDAILSHFFTSQLSEGENSLWSHPDMPSCPTQSPNQCQQTMYPPRSPARSFFSWILLGLVHDYGNGKLTNTYNGWKWSMVRGGAVYVWSTHISVHSPHVCVHHYVCTYSRCLLLSLFALLLWRRAFGRMARSPCWLDFPANELLGSARLCLLGSSYSYTESGPHC